MAFIILPMYREWPWGAAESEADPRELLPEVEPPAAPAPEQAASTELINEGGICYLSTNPCLISFS